MKFCLILTVPRPWEQGGRRGGTWETNGNRKQRRSSRNRGSQAYRTRDSNLGSDTANNRRIIPDDRPPPLPPPMSPPPLDEAYDEDGDGASDARPWDAVRPRHDPPGRRAKVVWSWVFPRWREEGGRFRDGRGNHKKNIVLLILGKWFNFCNPFFNMHYKISLQCLWLYVNKFASIYKKVKYTLRYYN